MHTDMSCQALAVIYHVMHGSGHMIASTLLFQSVSKQLEFEGTPANTTDLHLHNVTATVAGAECQSYAASYVPPGLDHLVLVTILAAIAAAVMFAVHDLSLLCVHHETVLVDLALGITTGAALICLFVCFSKLEPRDVSTSGVECRLTVNAEASKAFILAIVTKVLILFHALYVVVNNWRKQGRHYVFHKESTKKLQGLAEKSQEMYQSMIG